LNCPVCDGVRMREVDKEGVTIDICPQCKGVWLDRGELDKLMNGVREVRDEFNQWHQERHRDDDDDRYKEHNRGPYPQDQHRDSYPPDQHRGSYPPGQQSGPYYGKKKKRSFLDSLGDIFD
jgi:uncharacterized protein